MKPKCLPSSRTAASESDGDGDAGESLRPGEGDDDIGDVTVGDDAGPVVDVAAGVPFVHAARKIATNSDPSLQPMALTRE
jgi:hypothetical protein